MEPHIGLFYIFTAVYVTYTDAVVPYQENWIDQNVDHFNFYSTVYGKTTYKQKYLVQGDKLYFSWFIVMHGFHNVSNFVCVLTAWCRHFIISNQNRVRRVKRIFEM